jgi:hypothetical protein
LNSTHQVWLALSNHYAFQYLSQVHHLKQQLQNLHQDSKSCTEYLHDAKLWADQLKRVGKLVEEDDFISYVIGGLNASYTAFITTCSFALRISTMITRKPTLPGPRKTKQNFSSLQKFAPRPNHNFPRSSTTICCLPKSLESKNHVAQ